MIIVYILGIIAIPKFISQVKVLQICALLGLTLAYFVIYVTVQRFLRIIPEFCSEKGINHPRS